jgi:HlyD family secretion protein
VESIAVDAPIHLPPSPWPWRRLSVIVVCAAAALAAGIWLVAPARTPAAALRVAPVSRGDVAATISATGTIEPEAAVDIGAQVAGVIVEFGTDREGKPVTWGSVVEKGDVLAKIDDSLYVAAVKGAEAQLDQYSGQLARDQAILEKDRVDLGRYQILAKEDSIARQQAEDQTFVVRQDEAQVKLDIGLVETAKANLLTAHTNLGYCTIRSPVKGVVIDRRVNIGQTVVSSLNAPSLFLIANDLSRIQAWISVNEADVGSIARGQQVGFTVDALPGRRFRGRVGQVRLNATMTQNVVTYTVEVDIDNPDGALLPYLTVNAQFETSRRRDVWLVPNTALSWSPRPDQIAPGVRRGEKGGVIWVAEGKLVRPIPVEVGLSDGVVSEISGPDLREGIAAVVGEQSRGGDHSERNPFMPQIFRGQSGGGQPQQAPGTGR